MLTFAYYLLKVLICSGLLYGYYLFALRNKRFHQYNRWYLLSAVALSFIIPLMKIEFWKETAQPSTVMKVITVVNDADAYVVMNTPAVWSWNDTAIAVFGFVSFIFLLSTIVSLVKIFALIKKHPTQIFEKVCFVFSNTPGTPFSFFKYIFWNKDIDIESDTGKHILHHELAHVHEKHSSDKLFLNLVLVIGWFNPFFWLVRKELNLIHEFIADQKAVTDGDAHSLAMMLLKTSNPAQSFMFANSFFYSPVKRRLLMLTTLSPRYSYMRRIMVLPLFTLVIFLFAFRQKEIKQQQHAFKSASSADTLVPPKFPGGTGAWNRYLQRNIQWTTLEKSGAPKGSYKVKVRFAVDRTGKISNVTALTRNGYGFEDQAIRMIKKGPHWDPASRKGKSVDAVVERDFYFTIQLSQGASSTSLLPGESDVVTHVNNLEQQEKQKNDFSTYMQSKSDTVEPAKFPGGASAWKKYLERNLDANVCTNNKAPFGVYTVKLAFDVSKDGTISNIIAETKPGYGTEEEAIRVIAKSPKWEAAKKDGLMVNSRVKQMLSFSVTRDDTDDDASAQFPGGLQEWRRYLERNLNLKMFADKKVPVGKYPVVVSFTISKDGSVVNLAPKTKAGYGIEEEAMKTISKRKWQPAKKDGNAVDANAEQTVTFTVVKEGWAYVEINSMILGHVKADYVNTRL